MISKHKVKQNLKHLLPYRWPVLGHKSEEHKKAQLLIGVTLRQEGHQRHHMIMNRLLLHCIDLRQHPGQGVVA